MSACTLVKPPSHVPHSDCPPTLRLPVELDTDRPEGGAFRWPGQAHIDRRRRPRLALEQTIKLYDPVSSRYFAGHTRDVSESGLCLELPARVPARAGQTALVYVAAPADRRSFVEHTMLVPVRYVWVRRETDSLTGIQAGGDRCICGVEILADTASARKAA